MSETETSNGADLGEVTHTRTYDAPRRWCSSA